MIIDVTGIILTPGNCGKNCLGNGERIKYECCCDESDYAMCCREEHDMEECKGCSHERCPMTEI